ncbi:SUMF1/EgtB/PvdO family nonheme iron enzyme [Bacteroidota bacterium]
MKKFIIPGLVLALFLSSCGKHGNGELTGVANRSKWFEPEPFGMVKIPGGSFTMGPNDQDFASTMNAQSKTISVDGFWMDETEITNNEYRQFVEWVIDSLSRQWIGATLPDEFLISEDVAGNPIDPPFINWKTRIDDRNEDVAMALNNLYLNEEERFFRRKDIDARKLIYKYSWITTRQAAKKSNRYNYETNQYEGVVFNADGDTVNINDRSAFIMNRSINIYPDTLCWIADFTYSYNDPWTNLYFWHPGFDDYPVVGISWEQANAFSIWRTQYHNNYLYIKKTGATVHNYRLPTEYEWEYAARGGLQLSQYPWGGPYTRDKKGNFLANYKPLRGNYVEDGSIIPSEVGSYLPNGFGLYDMAGNVAEWTKSAYDESSYSFTHDLNPNYEYNALPDDPPVMKRKVIRGGSWKDISYFNQTSSRSYEYQDSTKSYIGFRCVRSSMGSRIQ